MKYLLPLLLILVGCSSIEQKSVSVVWPTEYFTNNYPSEYLFSKDIIWWSYEIGFASDGTVRWRTNAVVWEDWKDMQRWREYQTK